MRRETGMRVGGVGEGSEGERGWMMRDGIIIHETRVESKMVLMIVVFKSAPFCCGFPLFFPVDANTTTSHPLQRHAAARAVLDKQAAVDEPLVEVLGLKARVDDVVGARGLLEDADLELPVARVVVGKGAGRALEGLVVLGVVDLEGASPPVSSRSRRMPGKRTYFLL